MAVASTIGSRASAEKLQNMPNMLMSRGRRVRMGGTVRTARRELPAPGIDQHHGQDGEGRAVEHDLADRIPLARKRTSADITANKIAEMTLRAIA